MAIAFREPGRAAGEQDQRVAVVHVFGGRRRGHLPVVQQVGAGERFRQARFKEPVNVRLARDAHRGTLDVLREPLQLRRRQGRIHQCRRSANPRGTEHRRDRQEASDIDDGNSLAGQPTIGQARGALLDGHGQLAVADDTPIDDERSAVGVAGRGSVDDRSDVHTTLKTEVTTTRSAGAGWSTDRATQARRTSTCRGRGARAESRSEGV